jgi:hypothetical protein
MLRASRIVDDAVQTTAEEVSSVYDLSPPRNLISIEIVTEKSTKTRKLRVMCLYPEATNKILFEGKKGSGVHQSFNVRYPRILLCHTLLEDKTSPGTWIWENTKYYTAVNPDPSWYLGKPGIFTGDGLDSTNLMRLPFNNAYNDGNLCYGSVSFSRSLKAETLSQLDWMYNLLSESVYNTDLDYGGCVADLDTCVSKYPELAHHKSRLYKLGSAWWYGLLEMFETFPYDLLTRIDLHKVPDNVSRNGVPKRDVTMSTSSLTTLSAIKFLKEEKVTDGLSTKEMELLLSLVDEGIRKHAEEKAYYQIMEERKREAREAQSGPFSRHTHSGSSQLDCLRTMVPTPTVQHLIDIGVVTPRWEHHGVAP